MRAYKDDQYSSEIAADNTVHIGDRIWVKIVTTKNLPANIDYFLTDCTAYRDFTQKQNTETFNMIEVSLKLQGFGKWFSFNLLISFFNNIHTTNRSVSPTNFNM